MFAWIFRNKSVVSGILLDRFPLSPELPTQKDVLRFYEHSRTIKKLKSRPSAIETAKEIKKIWEDRGISTPDVYFIANKVEKLADEHNKMRKKKNQTGAIVIQRRDKFIERLNIEFNIAKLVQIIYPNQRPETNTSPPVETPAMLYDNQNNFTPAPGPSTNVALSVHDELISNPLNQSTGNENADKAEQNGRYDFRTRADPPFDLDADVDIRPDKNVSLMFDRIGLSYRQSSLAYLVISNSLGYDPDRVICSTSTMFRTRKMYREDEAMKIRQHLVRDGMNTIHFDGKTYVERGKRRDKRLAVVLSNRSNAKLLEVVSVNSGKGAAHAEAVFQAMAKWNVCETVKAICFDTEIANTGLRIGTCALLKKKLNKNLLELACRHHVAEIVLSEAFAITVENKAKVEGPTIKLFEHFCKQYFDESFRPELFTNCLGDRFLTLLIGYEKIQQIVNFCRTQLLTEQPRNDYEELLKLILVLLCPREATFKIQAPGAYTRARFMNRIIYCLKIYLYRAQLDVEPATMLGIKRFLVFVIKAYLEYWFGCMDGIRAPRNDLQFLKSLADLHEAMPILANSTYTKMCNHLWYLSETLIAFAFFDENVSIEDKRLMVQSLGRNSTSNSPNRAKIDEDIRNIGNYGLSDFVTAQTLEFFTIIQVNPIFFTVDPVEWNENESYISAREAVKTFPVVNDAAERSIALFQNYRDKAKGEQQLANLLQVAEEERHKYKRLRKSEIAQVLHDNIN